MKTAILTHADCDGLCCGALALAVYQDARVLFSNPVSLLSDLRHASEYDRIIVTDIAIDIGMSASVKKEIERVADGREVVFIDHHPLPSGISGPWLVHDINACGSLLTFNLFRQNIDADLSRVAMYGAIGDYRDTTPLAEKLVRRWDKRSLYYQAGTLSQGIEMVRRDYDYKRSIIDQLSRNRLPSEIEGLSQNAIAASHLEEGLRERVENTVEQMKNIAYVINPDGFISKAAIYARIYGDRPIGICAEHRDNKRVFDLSVRSTSDLCVNVLLNDSAVKFGGHGGGHPMASGGRIPATALKKFLADFDFQVGRALARKGYTGIASVCS